MPRVAPAEAWQAPVAEMMLVTCPTGVGAGAVITVQTTDALMLQVQVPPGVSEGTTTVLPGCVCPRLPWRPPCC
eukprot:COSAG01_NODE_9011_length_2583_cov_3.416264_3_plen_74_part_00